MTELHIETSDLKADGVALSLDLDQIDRSRLAGVDALVIDTRTLEPFRNSNGHFPIVYPEGEVPAGVTMIKGESPSGELKDRVSFGSFPTTPLKTDHDFAIATSGSVYLDKVRSADSSPVTVSVYSDDITIHNQENDPVAYRVENLGKRDYSDLYIDYLNPRDEVASGFRLTNVSEKIAPHTSLTAGRLFIGENVPEIPADTKLRAETIESEAKSIAAGADLHATGDIKLTIDPKNIASGVRIESGDGTVEITAPGEDKPKNYGHIFDDQHRHPLGTKERLGEVLDVKRQKLRDEFLRKFPEQEINYPLEAPSAQAREQLQQVMEECRQQGIVSASDDNTLVLMKGDAPYTCANPNNKKAKER